MVAIEEISSTTPTATKEEEEGPSKEEPAVSVSEERRLDAEEIEKVAATITRVSARMQLESLAKRLRKESEALARVEQSKQRLEQAQEPSLKEETQTTTTPSPAPVATTTTPATPFVPSSSSSVKYVSIDKFAFDAGGYNAPFVTLYIELMGVGSIPRDQIICQFTSDSFDLIIKDLNSKSYRLWKDNLEKDIDPEKSKIVVKKDRLLVKLAKVKQGEYGGYDYWSQLTAKKSKKEKKATESNPQASIMELMKDMYDSGDDNMRKVIGETMMKQQRGELGNGMGGMDPTGMGMGDF